MSGIGQIDLARQAALGLAQALPITAGGTARDDGMATGLVLRVINDSGGALPAGSLVKVNTGSTLSGNNGKVTNPGAGDFVIGVTVGAIANNSPGDVLTLGLHRTVLSTGTINLGDLLYPSASAGYVTATGASGAVPVGYALTAASGTSTVTMWFDPTPAGFALSHARLLNAQGVKRHSDLLEATRDAQFGTSYSSTNFSALHDRDDTTYFLMDGAKYVYVLFGYAQKAAAARLVLTANNTGGGTGAITGCSIEGSNDGSSWTTLWSGSLTYNNGGVGSGYDQVVTWAPPGTAYLYYRLNFGTVGSGSAVRIQTWELEEAAGGALYVQNAAGTDSALLDSVLAAIAAAAVAIGGAAGGDLAGTFPNPTVVGLSHATGGGDLSGAMNAPTVAKINGSPLGSMAGAAAGDRLRFGGSSWSPSSAIWRPVMAQDPSTGQWWTLVTGDGDAVMTEA